jgi:hypothetical protein
LAPSFVPVETGGLTTPARVWVRRHTEQRPDRQLDAVSQPWLDRRPSPAVHPDLAPAVVFSVPDQDRASALVKIGLGQRERLVDPQTGAPQHDHQGDQAMTVAIIPGLAHDRDDGGSAG